MSEERMRGERREFAIERIQNIQHAAHHSNRVATFRWQAAVCSAAMRQNLEPRVPLVRDGETQIGRLDHDRRICGVALEQSFRADAVAFFIHHGCNQQRLVNRPCVSSRNRGSAHRSHAAFDIERAAAVETAITFARRERLGHVAGADRVDVGENRERRRFFFAALFR